MANPAPLSRRAKADYSPKVRKAFWDALRLGAEENNCTLPQLLWQWIDATPDAEKRKWLDTLSRFEVRHKHVKGEVAVTHEHRFQTLKADLERLVAETSGRTIESSAERVEEVGQNKSLVFNPPRSEST